MNDEKHIENDSPTTIILYREVFEESDWAVCKRIFGFTDGHRIERIVAHVDSVDVYLND